MKIELSKDQLDTEEALSERFSALIAQNHYAEICAIKLRDQLVFCVVIEKLRDFVYDMRDFHIGLVESEVAREYHDSFESAMTVVMNTMFDLTSELNEAP